MSNTQNTQEVKEVKFKGKTYVAVPEKVAKCCKGCALENKGCYDHVRVQAICHQGYIFELKNKKD